MKCRNAVREINEMLDGRLQSHRREELRLHLQSCPACRSAASSLQATHDMLADGLSDKIAPPPHLYGHIMTAVGRERPMAQVVPLFRLRLLATAAAVLLIVFSAWMAYHCTDGSLAVPNRITTVAPPSRPRPVQPPREKSEPAVEVAVSVPEPAVEPEPEPAEPVVKTAVRHTKTVTAATANPQTKQTPQESIIAAYEKAVAAEPRSTEARYLAAEAYWHLGNYAQALAHYHRAVDLNPADPIAYRYLAAAYQNLGMSDEAAQTYAQGISRTGDVQLMVSLGKIQERSGELATAIETYADAAVAASDVYIN